MRRIKIIFLVCLLVCFFKMQSTRAYSDQEEIDQKFISIKSDFSAVDKFGQENSIGFLSPHLRQEMESILIKAIKQGKLQRAKLIAGTPSSNAAVSPSSVKGKKGKFDGFTGRISFVSLEKDSNTWLKIRFETPSDIVRLFQDFGGGWASEQYIDYASVESFRSSSKSSFQTGHKEAVFPRGVLDLPYGHESVHRYIGKHILPRIIYEGDNDAPLTFLLLSGKGWIYLCGKGRVSLKGPTGDVIRVIELPKDLNVSPIE